MLHDVTAASVPLGRFTYAHLDKFMQVNSWGKFISITLANIVAFEVDYRK